MSNSTQFPAPIPLSTSAANTYSDPNGLAALKASPNSPQALHAVAQQVDALFLQMMLKSMRDAAADVGEPESNEMGMYQDMFDKQIALTMSQHQDLGLGSVLTRRLAGAQGQPAPAQVAPAKTSTATASAASGSAVSVNWLVMTPVAASRSVERTPPQFFTSSPPR